VADFIALHPMDYHCKHLLVQKKKTAGKEKKKKAFISSK